MSNPQSSASLHLHPMYPYRWLILLLVSITMAASYYFYDMLAPIKSELQKHLGITSAHYGFIMFTYSIPNGFLLLAALGGMILDRFGIRRTGSLFVVLMTLGATITALATSDTFRDHSLVFRLLQRSFPAWSPSFVLMSLGFFLFGLGAETSLVVINTVIVKWFRGAQLATALAVNLSIARAGSGLSYNLAPWLSDKYDWNGPVFFAALLMCIGLLTFAVYLLFDRRYDRQAKTIMPPTSEEKFRFRDVLPLFSNRGFIYITLVCMAFYSVFFPFMKYAPDMLLNTFHFTEARSGHISSLMAWGMVVFTPLFGLYTDLKGRSASLMLVGSATMLITIGLFTFTRLSPSVLMIACGMVFSLIPAAMWPSVARIVDPSKIGTAYGVMFSFQNLVFGVVNWVLGLILDATNPHVTPELLEQGKATYDYTETMFFVLIISVVSLYFSWRLVKINRRFGLGLERPSVADR